MNRVAVVADEVIAELGERDAGANRRGQRLAGIKNEEIPDPLLLEDVDDQRADPGELLPFLVGREGELEFCAAGA